MEPEELMIGDIVNVHRCECVADGGHFQEWDEYGKVVSITEYYITIKYIGREEDYGFEDVNGEDINPIPLTPEILEQNGFIGDKNVCKTKVRDDSKDELWQERNTWYMALENVSFDLGLFLKPDFAPLPLGSLNVDFWV